MSWACTIELRMFRVDLILSFVDALVGGATKAQVQGAWCSINGPKLEDFFPEDFIVYICVSTNSWFGAWARSIPSFLTFFLGYDVMYLGMMYWRGCRQQHAGTRCFLMTLPAGIPTQLNKKSMHFEVFCASFTWSVGTGAFSCGNHLITPHRKENSDGRETNGSDEKTHSFLQFIFLQAIELVYVVRTQAFPMVLTFNTSCLLLI